MFSTNRLAAYNCMSKFTDNRRLLATKALEILTPAVVQSLPADWQNITTPTQAIKWIQDRVNECLLLSIQLKDSNEIIGFMFIHQSQSKQDAASLQIGYLIGEAHWGRGYASEILVGLVDYYRAKSNIDVLFAGVESDNLASIKVLQKCGFVLRPEEPLADGNLFYENQLR